MKNNKKNNRIKNAIESLSKKDILSFAYSDSERWEVYINSLGYVKDFWFSSDSVNFDKDNLTDEECVIQAIVLQWEKDNDEVEKTIDSIVAKVVDEANKFRGKKK